MNNSEDSYQNKLICNDEPVTGKQRLTTKTVIISKSVEEFMQRRKNQSVQSRKQISNVLYANSYVVKGQGTAVVCAVGANTQYGMFHSSNQEDMHGHIMDEKMEFSDVLDSYCVYVGHLVHTFAFCYMIIIMAMHEYYQLDTELGIKKPKDHYNSEERFCVFLNQTIVVLCLMIAVIPEALSLAVIQCISEYSSLELFSKGKIVFKNMKSLEKIGKVKYICLGKRGMFTDLSGLRVKQLKIVGIDFGTKFEDEKQIRTMRKLVSLNLLFNASAWVE